MRCSKQLGHVTVDNRTPPARRRWAPAVRLELSVGHAIDRPRVPRAYSACGAAHRWLACARLTNAREGVHKGEIERGVNLGPIGRGIVNVQFANEMVRLTGGEGEGFAVGAAGVLQALAI
jgi:hypothetical protein